MFDTSSAGHVSAGEDALTSAVREMSEELGIVATPDQLHRIGTIHIQYEKPFHGRLYRDNELADVYVYGEPVENLTLQASEVSEVRWFNVDEVWNEIKSGDRHRFCVPTEGLKLLKEHLENMEYTIETCSLYRTCSILGKPVVIFDEHNWALPVWGTYARRLGKPLNLITFDTHTDTHAPFLRYLKAECNVEDVPYDKSVLKLPQIVKLFKNLGFKRDDYNFESLFRLADCIANDEQILTASVLGYLESYAVVHKENDDFSDVEYGYNSEYIKHESFISGSQPDIKIPLALDIDLDYFGKNEDIYNWLNKAEKYIKAASVITIAAEPDWVERCKTDSSFEAGIAEQEVLNGIKTILEPI